MDVVAIIITGGAEAGDAQRQLSRMAKRRKHISGKNLADRAEGIVAGKGHRCCSATGGGGLSSTFQPVTAKPARTLPLVAEGLGPGATSGDG